MKTSRFGFAGLVVALSLGLSGCAQDIIDRESIPENIRNLAKSSLDHALDAHLNATTEHLTLLMRELYALNPEELAKNPDATVERRVALLLPNRVYDDLRFGELDGQRSTAAMTLAFDPNFLGDRVFALMVGIVSQMQIAYGDRAEFFALDFLHAESVKSFSTNLQIIALNLQHQKTADGAPLLRYQTLQPVGKFDLEALSVMQILERTIGSQEILADIAGQREDRGSAAAVRTFGSIVLMPVP